MLREWLLASLLGVAVVIVLAGCATQDSGWGDAPDFSFTPYGGAETKLSGLAGKPTVVNFWAVW